MYRSVLLLSAAGFAASVPVAEIGSGIHAGHRAEYRPVAVAVVDVIESNAEELIPLLVRLAWHTMAQYNKNMPILGGSNGGCQRFDPERSDPENAGLDVARDLLEDVKAQFPFITYADMYILAGNTALEYAGTDALPFRPGREDYTSTEAAAKCPLHSPSRMPRKHENLDVFPHVDTLAYFHKKFAELNVEGASKQESSRLRVALMGGHTLGGLHRDISGGNGKWTSTPFEFNNEYYTALVQFEWDTGVPGTNQGPTPHDDLQYEEQCDGCPDGKLVMLPIDIILTHDADLMSSVTDFANDAALFRAYFTRAWTLLAENGVSFPNTTTSGLMTYVYTAPAMTTFPNYDALTPSTSFVSSEVDFSNADWTALGFVNDFASRHVGSLVVSQAGEYVLHISSDDGSRLYLDGQLVIDNGGQHGLVTEEVTLQLAAGPHAIEFQYFESGGDAVTRLEWTPPNGARAVISSANLLAPSDGGSSPPPTATPTRTPPTGTGNGLTTQVFVTQGDITNFVDYASLAPTETWTSSTIDFSNADWAAHGYPSGTSTTFASRHVGYLIITEAGDYTFYISSDDGSRLYVDGALAVDNGGRHGLVTVEATLNLGVGLHAVDFQFFDAGGDAVTRLEWTPPNGARAVVPEAHLATSGDVAVPPSTPPAAQPTGVPSSAAPETAEPSTVTPLPPVTPVPPPAANGGTGLTTYVYTTGEAVNTFPNYAALTPVATFRSPVVNYGSADWEAMGFVDNFASRHVGSLVVTDAGDYTLHISSDDGSRLYLDGRLVIDNGGQHGLATESITLRLQARPHALVLEYFEAGGEASTILEWTPAGSNARSVVPEENLSGGGAAPPATPVPRTPQPTQVPPPGVTPKPVTTSPPPSPVGTLNGLMMYVYSIPGVGEFPDYAQMTPDVVAGTPEIDFNQMAFAAYGVQDEFATLHQGHLDVPATGSYRFYLTSDDGSRLFLDGAVAIDNGGRHGAVTLEATLDLARGLHAIEIQYFESGGSSDVLRLEWDPPGAAPRAVVSMEYLVGGGIALTPAPTPVPTPPVTCEKSDGTPIAGLDALSTTPSPAVLNYAVSGASAVVADATVYVRGGVTLRVTADAGGDAVLRFQCIVVEAGGKLEIGGDDCETRLELVSEGACPGEASGGIVVQEGGELHMVGNLPERTWTTMKQPSRAGSRVLTVTDSVAGWRDGDRVGVASSDYDAMFTEEVVLSQAGGTAAKELRLTSDLEFYHHGSDEEATGGVDVEQAEVVLLSRRVVLRGGFVKVTAPKVTIIRGVLFEGATDGEGPVVAHEALHLSLVGNAFVNSRRCVFTMGVERGVFIDNVAFRCKGNCFLMSGPSNVLNHFENNVVVAVLFDETAATLMEREGAAGFLMTNPDNTWVNNRVAGSAYSAFVFNVGTCEGYNTHQIPLRQFSGNRMHSCGQGLPFVLTDNVRFDRMCSDVAPDEVLVFHDLVMWKIWGEGGHKRGNVVFKGGVWSDCHQGWQNFQGGTIPHDDGATLWYGQYEGVIFVGRSSNPGNVDSTLRSDIQTCVDIPMERFNVVEKRCIPYATERSEMRSSSFIMYDGPTVFHSCAFVNIDGDKYCFAAPRYAANSFLMTVRHEVTHPSILDYDFTTGRVTRSTTRDATSLLCRNRIGYEGEDRFMVSLKIAPDTYMVPYEPAYYTPQCTKTEWCQRGTVGGPDGGCFYVCKQKMVDIRLRVSVPQVMTLCRGDDPTMCLDFKDGTSGGHDQFQFPAGTFEHFIVRLPAGGEVKILMVSADAGDWVDFTIQGQTNCNERVTVYQGDYEARAKDDRLVEVFDQCRLRVKQVANRRDYYSWCPEEECTQIWLHDTAQIGLAAPRSEYFEIGAPIDPDLLFGPDQCATNPCGDNACLWRQTTFRCIPLS
ncbi:Cytochrome c peroxidase [Diplonema papillatum]|nr:Cytochrome c peroxidase [Diplonema papillatum]